MRPAPTVPTTLSLRSWALCAIAATFHFPSQVCLHPGRKFLTSTNIRNTSSSATEEVLLPFIWLHQAHTIHIFISAEQAMFPPLIANWS